MSLTYIMVALVAVLLNNALVERLSLHTRITAGAPPRLPPGPSRTPRLCLSLPACSRALLGRCRTRCEHELRP